MEETEKEFLKKYDASKYQKPSVAADIVIFSTLLLRSVISFSANSICVPPFDFVYKSYQNTHLHSSK